MGKNGSTFRRSAAALAVAIGMLAVSGTGASAAANGLPAILNGVADSQALRITLTLPSSDSLKAALNKVNPNLEAVTSVLPGGLLGQTIEQTISLQHGELLRSATSSVADHASGFASPLQGLLGGADKVASRCDGNGCDKAQAMSLQSINVLEQVIPGGIGTIQIAGAESTTKSLVDTRNASRLAKVNLRLAPLFAIEGLEPVAEALRTLTSTLNEQVLPVVNDSVIAPVADIVNGALDGTVLEEAIEVGEIKDIPDLTKVNLLDLTVLDSHANVTPFTPKSGPGAGVKGLLASSASKVANLDILGLGDNAWAHVGAVGLNTSSFANGVKGAATAGSDVEIVGADLGGLLGLSIPVATLRDLTDGTALKDVIDGLDLPVENDLLNAVDLLYNVAGITIDTFTETTNIDPKGNFANASAGTIAITVEPKLITESGLTKLTGGLGGANIIPALGKNDFVSTGLRLQVLLPNASSGVSIGDVKGGFTSPPRTGVGVPLLGAVALIGAAVLVRRFALAK